MKPIKLIMSAFGSYGEVEEIDFSQVNRGIFLITGDTGAGKTTIFDAITYALFDETSGGRRDGDMMRSQYAKDATPTYVEYTFSYAGEQYTVRRNPNYRRISKRKNKEGEYTYTTENAAVELTMPDGTVFPGKNKETNEKIREILGVDVNQFTQISMIAQGEFLKLLHAPSKERKEIFARIFDTKIFWQIQNALKEESKKVTTRLKENDHIIEYELKNIKCPDDFFEEEWQRALEKMKTGKDEILTCLSRMDDYQEYRCMELEGKLSNLTKEIEQLKSQIAQGEETNQQFEQKKQLEESIKEIRKNLEQIQEKMGEQNLQKKEHEAYVAERMPVLEQEIAHIRNLLPKYELLENRKTEAATLHDSAKKAEQDFEKVTGQAEQLTNRIQKLQENQRELMVSLEELPTIRQQETNCNQRTEELKQLQTRCATLSRQQAVFAELYEKVSAALTEMEQKNRFYETCNRIFLEEQAGVLAEGLQEGMACPVCGSTRHPKKAVLSTEAVTSQQLEQAKEEKEDAGKRLECIQTKFLQQKEQWEGERNIILHVGKTLLGQEFGVKLSEQDTSSASEAIKICGLQVKEALLESNEQQESLKNRRQQLEENERCYRKQEKELEAFVLKQEQVQKQREELQKECYEKRLTYEKALQSLKELQETLQYSSRDVLNEKYQKLEAEKKQLEEKQKILQEQITRLKQEQAKDEGVLQEQEKQLTLLAEALKEKAFVDISKFKEREQELEEERHALEKQRIDMVMIKNRNEQARRNLRRLYEEREWLARKYEVVETLSQTANGNLRQQIRLDLQTYVQRRYFKQIIGEANRRLIEMSSGQFVLRCRELEDLAKQGEAGLDLDVYDLVTDKVRDVKTLSGGESFLAALSMALGMADVIQKHAGRVHLDTMFIDEGFGSLDEESRGKAIGILNKLAGETRLVGIISHVTELKEQMDRKLLITKSDTGSHAGWSLES